MNEFDIRRIQEEYRREANKHAVDQVCKWVSIGLVAGFWVLIVGLCLLEAGR